MNLIFTHHPNPRPTPPWNGSGFREPAVNPSPPAALVKGGDGVERWEPHALVKIVGCDLLRDGRVLREETLWIRDGRVVDPRGVFFGERRGPDVVVDFGGRGGAGLGRVLVVPGFVDVQINGSFGFDFADAENIEEAVQQVSKGLVRLGVTAFCPTIVTSEPGVYRKVLPKLHPRKGSVKDGAEVLGAHQKESIRSAPNGYSDVSDCYGLSDATCLKAVRIVTVAPEVEGMVEAVSELTRLGVVVSMGHTGVDGEGAERAVQNGTFLWDNSGWCPVEYRFQIFFLGTPSPSFPSKKKGSVAEYVKKKNVKISVHPSTVRIAYRAHPEGAILVTDAISPAGIDSYDPLNLLSSSPSEPSPPGSISRCRGKGFWLGKLRVLLRNQNKEVVLEGTGTLAGSVATMPECIRNLIRFTGCSIAEAVNAATFSPASALGILDRKGSLRFGSDADFVVLTGLDGPGGEAEFKISGVFVGGQEVEI
ncbi:hypothetical protein HDU67_007058 [Dinochytrium kinnereticum]|nr:hypothetical protein HDU67_007058 [Dinochytrium kinnereticum]